VNQIENLMVQRSSQFKLAVAVVALVLVLWISGSSLESLWMTPVIIFVLWVTIQVGFGYLHRRHP
jgi:diacylglycerol kinase